MSTRPGVHKLGPNVISVVIVDRQQAVREGVRFLLEEHPDIVVVAETSDGSSATALVAEVQPDLVIIDPDTVGGNGLEAVREIAGQVLGPKVIVLSDHHDDERVLRAVRAGALSYLPKDTHPDELVRAVRAAAQGESVLDDRIAQTLLQEELSPDRLTPRELGVLALMAHGHSNREIAAQLGLGEETVKTHVSNVLAKLGVADRTQAAVEALRLGLVPLDRPDPTPE
jgi:two-component system, NarL family, response regulator LiaR